MSKPTFASREARRLKKDMPVDSASPRGKVMQLINQRWGVFIADAVSDFMVDAFDTRAEAEKEALRITPRSYFMVRATADMAVVVEVRLDEWQRKRTAEHRCASPAELHRLRLRLIDQGLYERKPD